MSSYSATLVRQAKPSHPTPRETSKTFCTDRSRDKQNLLYRPLERQAKPSLNDARETSKTIL